MLRGDEEAFVTFFVTYTPRLYRFTLARVGNEDATEEIVQATLVQVIRKLNLFRGDAALFTWMVTLCRHEIGAWLSRAGLRPTVALEEDLPEVRKRLDTLAVQAASLEDDFERREMARLVRVALDFLPSRYGDVLEWKYIQELSVAEIAGRLGISSKAAESRLARARTAFRSGFEALTARRREPVSPTGGD